MRRTRAQALALVNWKGVFYERYLLDRHVTALEGANGAGKTTVMIAAYLVLLPDMTRLRFTNLGETGATGGDKGIWGRLGEPGRPSYAVLDFALPDGRRLLAGVHLERKGEPSVEPTPFVIADLAADVRLQELLLVPQGGGEGIPELPELRENAARFGGRLQVFHSARDYFAELFEAGVLPLRLATDEERNKFNEMLRTSMTGGISRALTSELRSFLLKEEGGLAETLRRMMDNLAACKRTRGEVEEARRLEGGNRRVFEAGQTMFAAAYAASREAAEELRRKVAEAEKRLAEAEEARAAAEAALARVREEQGETARRREQLGTELSSWRERAARLGKALEAAARVREEREALAFQRAVTEEAERVRDEAVREVALARAARDEARADHRLAAAGLADLQAGLDLLHRHAAAHAEFARRRAAAERLLRIEELPLEAPQGLLAEVRAALETADRERREATVRLADADHHRAAFARVREAVGRMAGEVPDPEAALETARAELRKHRERESLAARLPEITRELGAAERLAVRQADVRRRAGELGLAPGDEPGSVRLRVLLDALEEERDSLEEAARADREALAEVERAIRDGEARLAELARREPVWQELAARAARLAGATSVDVGDGAGLQAARATIRDRELEARGRSPRCARRWPGSTPRCGSCSPPGDRSLRSCSPSAIGWGRSFWRRATRRWGSTRPAPSRRASASPFTPWWSRTSTRPFGRWPIGRRRWSRCGWWAGGAIAPCRGRRAAPARTWWSTRGSPSASRGFPRVRGWDGRPASGGPPSCGARRRRRSVVSARPGRRGGRCSAFRRTAIGSSANRRSGWPAIPGCSSRDCGRTMPIVGPRRRFCGDGSNGPWGRRGACEGGSTRCGPSSSRRLSSIRPITNGGRPNSGNGRRRPGRPRRGWRPRGTTPGSSRRSWRSSGARPSGITSGRSSTAASST